MAPELIVVNTEDTNPYHNLALEEYFIQHVKSGQVIMYLWQNRRTVVVGKNQNAWQECNVELLEKEGGFLARRRSGGGAVFHDLGNLNFTFVARDGDYNLEKQFEVILVALRKLGLNAEKSGRNDVLLDGRKFSGNAFQSKQGVRCHHGTLLINVDRQLLGRYLKVSSSKMQSKGVKSVQARVTNLIEHLPFLSIELMRKNLIEAFAEVYGAEASEHKVEDFDKDSLNAIMNEFASWQWRFGRSIPFSNESEQRFSWGNAQVQLSVNEGIIQQAIVYSDALETAVFTEVANALRGVPFTSDAVQDVLSKVSFLSATEEQIVSDISSLIHQMWK